MTPLVSLDAHYKLKAYPWHHFTSYISSLNGDCYFIDPVTQTTVQKAYQVVYFVNNTYEQYGVSRHCIPLYFGSITTLLYFVNNCLWHLLGDCEDLDKIHNTCLEVYKKDDDDCPMDDAKLAKALSSPYYSKRPPPTLTKQQLKRSTAKDIDDSFTGLYSHDLLSVKHAMAAKPSKAAKKTKERPKGVRGKKERKAAASAKKRINAVVSQGVLEEAVKESLPDPIPAPEMIEWKRPRPNLEMSSDVTLDLPEHAEEESSSQEDANILTPMASPAEPDDEWGYSQPMEDPADHDQADYEVLESSEIKGAVSGALSVPQEESRPERTSGEKRKKSDGGSDSKKQKYKEEEINQILKGLPADQLDKLLKRAREH